MSSCSTCLARLIPVPTVTPLVSLAPVALAFWTCHRSADVHWFRVTVHGRLWKEIFRPASEGLAKPLAPPTSSGFQSCRDNPLIVRCSIACELSRPCGSLRPSRPTRAKRLRTGSPSATCTGTLLEARRARVSAEPLSPLGPSPRSVLLLCLHAQSVWLLRAVFAASTAHSSFCPLSLDGSVMTALRNLCCSLVLGICNHLQHHQCCGALLS